MDKTNTAASDRLSPGQERWTEESVTRQLSNENVINALKQRLDIKALTDRLNELERRLRQAGL